MFVMHFECVLVHGGCAICIASFPRLSKLLVKPGMMWPLRASSVGIAGMARTAAPVEDIISPVAVLIDVLGALTLMLSSGACGVK